MIGVNYPLEKALAEEKGK